MKDRNAIPLKRTGLFGTEPGAWRGSGRGSCNAAFLRCSAAQGDEAAAAPPARCGGPGQVAPACGGERKVGPFLGKRVLPPASVFWVALVTWAQGEERGGKVCCSVCGGFDSFRGPCVRFWEGNLV